MERIITISLPISKKEKFVQIKLTENSPYLFVEAVRENWGSLAKPVRSKFGIWELADLLPIHNASGIRDSKQIIRMGKALKRGRHILGGRGLPNIKMVVAPNGKLLIFDGHHSLISYHGYGKRFLKEIPYLVISAPGYQPVTPEEISYFFPVDSRDKVKQNWENYTINWETSTTNQLEERKVESLAQLAGQLRERDKSAVKQQS